MVPGSSQGALGTSQRGLVALLGHPNCCLEGSWGGLGSSLGPLGGVLGPRWPFFWRLGGSPGFLFGDILSPREGFAAKTVKSLILMTFSSELLTFRGLGGLKIRSKSLLGALGAPLDVKMELLGATRLPKRGFWRLRGRLGTPKWSPQGLRLTSARRQLVKVTYPLPPYKSTTLGAQRL